MLDKIAKELKVRQSISNDPPDVSIYEGQHRVWGESVGFIANKSWHIIYTLYLEQSREREKKKPTAPCLCVKATHTSLIQTNAQSVKIACNRWKTLFLSGGKMLPRSESVLCPSHPGHRWHAVALNRPVQPVAAALFECNLTLLQEKCPATD